MEFFTVTLGNLLSAIAFIIGGVSFAYTIRGDVKSAVLRLDNVERELHELRKVVVSIARQEERMNAIDQRLLAQGQRMDDCVRRLDRYLDPPLK